MGEACKEGPVNLIARRETEEYMRERGMNWDHTSSELIPSRERESTWESVTQLRKGEEGCKGDFYLKDGKIKTTLLFRRRRRKQQGRTAFRIQEEE